MSRPVTKGFLGDAVTEVRLGDLKQPLTKEARAEKLHVADLIRRELGRFLQYRGHRVPRPYVDPPAIKSRVEAARR